MNLYKVENTTQYIRSIMIACAIFSSLLASSVYAAENVDDVDDAESEKIVITGSRIPRKELSQPSPVLVIGREELDRFGSNDLASVLAELPAIASSSTLVGNSQSNSAAGISSANLRDLGPTRTLVLVNGKRHVASTPGTAQVDLTTIPASLVERVEIITGGASAVYGSDAVTGVINIILRKDYEGLELNLRGAKSIEGVGDANYSFNLLAGTSFSEGRGNITFNVGKDYIHQTMRDDLQHLKSFSSISNPLDTGENDGIPDRLTVPHVGSEFINEFGVINSFFGAGAGRWTFTPDGSPILQQERVGTNSFAFGNFPGGCSTCFFGQTYQNVLPEHHKIHFGGTLNYDITDNISLYSELKYIRSDITQQFQPSFRFGNVRVNVTDNAFLDGTLRQLLLDNGQTNVRFAKFFDELGNRTADNRRETARFVIGLEGTFDLSDTPMDYDLYYVNGRTDNQRFTLNSLIIDNFTAALDSVIDPATGLPACRSQVPSAQGVGYQDPASLRGDTCVAYNPFGLGVSSQAARDFVSADVLRQDSIGQEFFGGQIGFDTSEFLELPGGGVGVAFGFESRKEFSDTITDSLTQSDILTNAASPDESGKYDVDEVFIEISLPILADMEFAKELTLDLAYRNADYSHAGNADAWKIGLVYAPFDDIRIRGTIGESVRAPDISEAFSPQSPGFARVSDPCDADNIGDDVDRTANCAALGIPVGFEANDNVSIRVVTGGNPDLTPENSESSTFGIVWTPSFIENLSVTVDAYKIEISDAILSVSAQTVADNCVDATAGLDTGFCAQIDRDPITNDIDLIRSGFINGSALNASGIEAEINYAMDLGGFDLPGRIAMKLFVSKVTTLETFEFQNLPEEINVEVGEVADPEWQARFSFNYIVDDLSVNWTTRFVDRSARFDVTPNDDIAEDLSPAFIGSVTTHDLSATYKINDSIRVLGGIRNIGNKLAPGYTQNPIYDLIGRRIFAGVTVNL